MSAACFGATLSWPILYINEIGWRVWTALIWLLIGTSGGSTRTRSWPFWFHKIQGIDWLAEELLAFQEGIWSMELYIVQVPVKCTDSRRQSSPLTYAINRLKRNWYNSPQCESSLNNKLQVLRRWVTETQVVVKWPVSGQQVVRSSADRHARPPTEVAWTHVDIKKYFQDPKFG
jgi:hypothetical protein